jgi:hypothetical protein
MHVHVLYLIYRCLHSLCAATAASGNELGRVTLRRHGMLHCRAHDSSTSQMASAASSHTQQRTPGCWIQPLHRPRQSHGTRICSPVSSAQTGHQGRHSPALALPAPLRTRTPADHSWAPCSSPPRPRPTMSSPCVWLRSRSEAPAQGCWNRPQHTHTQHTRQYDFDTHEP